MAKRGIEKRERLSSDGRKRKHGGNDISKRAQWRIGENARSVPKQSHDEREEKNGGFKAEEKEWLNIKKIARLNRIEYSNEFVVKQKGRPFQTRLEKEVAWKVGTRQERERESDREREYEGGRDGLGVTFYNYLFLRFIMQNYL